MTAFVRGPVGWVEVICGPMFSGKSEELIRRLRRAQIARQRVQVFKPEIDDRYSEQEIVSHSEQRIPARNVHAAREILEGVEPRTQVVGIDEAHFYDDEIATVVESLANVGKRVIVAGLDLDYLGEPFDHVTRLLAQAEEITKTLAICMRCGNPASRTQRLVPNEERIVVGGSRAYEARCRQCFEPRLWQVELPLEERGRKAGP
jgi:thymidine kinase